MASGSWLLTTDGAWNNNANWSAAFPNATTDTATFATDITGTTTVTMGQAISVGSMTFSDNGASGSAWVIAPGGAFALTLGTSTLTTTTDATISASVSGTAAVTKEGSATLTLTGGGANTGTWAINNGTVAVTSANFTGTTGLITVAATGKLTSTATIAKPITINAGSTGNDFMVAGASVVTVNGTAIIRGATTGLVTVGAGATATFQGNTGALTLSGTNTLNTGVTSANANYSFGSAGRTLITVNNGRSIASIGSSNNFVFGSAGNVLAFYLNGGTISSAGASGGGGYGLNIASDTSGSYIYLLASSGSLTASGHFGLGADLRTTNKGGLFVGDITGASLSQTSTSIGGIFVGPSSYGQSVLNLYGGSHSVATSFNVGNSAAVTGSYQQIVTMSGSSTSLSVTNAAGAVQLGSGGTGPSILNLLAGATISAPTYQAYTGTTNSKYVNLRGGILTVTGTYASTLTTTLYSAAAANRVSGGTVATGVISAAITDASGYGVSTIAVSTAGSGYVGAPAVQISGGSPTVPATARAIVDLTVASPTYGQLTSIEVTNPGSGYGAADVLTATLTGGGATSVATLGAVTLAANVASAGLEKVGTGTLSLAGTNTYTTPTKITDGTLSIGNGVAAGTLGLNDTSAVSIASGKTLNFNRSDSRTYTVVISDITTGGNISKTTSGGTAILDADNTFTGTVTATSGALRAVRAASFGAGASSLTTASGGAIELDGGITVARAVNLVGTGVSSTGALRNITGNNEISGTVAFTTGASIGSDAGMLTLSNTGTVSVAAGTLNFVGAGDVDFSPVLALTSGGVTKSAGTGAAILRGTNTYTGVNTITAGRLGYVGSIAPSVAGNFGNASAAANILIAANAGVRYYGSGSATFSRNYTFQGGAGTANYLESNGVGAVTHSLAPTYATANVTKTLGLGGTGTAANTIGYVIANNGTGAVSVTKADAGKWVLSQANTATGAYAVDGGTLVLQGTNTPASVAVSNAGATLGLEIATWAAGTRRVGTATVTVNANAKIQTFNGSGASAQNGRHTYTNLTFAANGRIRIGG